MLGGLPNVLLRLFLASRQWKDILWYFRCPWSPVILLDICRSCFHWACLPLLPFGSVKKPGLMVTTASNKQIPLTICILFFFRSWICEPSFGIPLLVFQAQIDSAKEKVITKTEPTHIRPKRPITHCTTIFPSISQRHKFVLSKLFQAGSPRQI